MAARRLGSVTVLARHFKRKCPLRNKGGERNSLDSIGSVAESEVSNELLVVSKELVGCGISKMVSKGSTECGWFERAATVIDV